VESRVVYAPPGFLLFHRQGTLFAQAFDATRLALQGVPVRIADGIVWAGNGNGAFHPSEEDPFRAFRRMVPPSFR
jgi:hypothetical protein